MIDKTGLRYAFFKILAGEGWGFLTDVSISEDYVLRCRYGPIY